MKAVLIKLGHMYGLPVLLIFGMASGIFLLSEFHKSSLAASGIDNLSTFYEFVQSWAKAWEKNIHSIDEYKKFYDPSFTANPENKPPMNYDEWMKDKIEKAKEVSCIQVVATDITVDLKGDYAVVYFKQMYDTDKHCDIGWKTMTLRKTDMEWFIIGEEQDKVKKCEERCI